MIYVTVTTDNGFLEYWFEDEQYLDVTDYLMTNSIESKGR